MAQSNDPDSNRENFHFILTKKGINRAASDVGFMFVAYNLKRLLNLIDKKDLLKYLKRLAHLFFAQNALFRGVIRPFNFSYPFYPTQIPVVVFVS